MSVKAPGRGNQRNVAQVNRIVLAGVPADLQLRLRAVTDAASPAAPGPLPVQPADLFRQLEASTPPEVLMLGSAGVDIGHVLQLAERVGTQYPGISVILVSEFGGEVALAALRAGVRDVLDPGADVDEIRTVLQRATIAARTRALDLTRSPVADSGRVISVVSPKGGVGKTTVATNLAVGLALASPHSTVLVDLDVQFGDVATALNLTPEYFLPDAVHGPAGRDAMVLKTFLSMHPTGLYALCGSESPAAADSVSPEQVGALLQLLASEFRYVVVDTAPGLSEHTLTAMDHSTDLVLLTSMDVPGVRGLRKELDTLAQLGMASGGRHVVLNFADRKRRGGLSAADVAATLDTEIDLILPRSSAVIASVNQGIPLLQSGGREPITKQLQQLVRRFLPVPPRAPGLRHGRHHRQRAQ